MKPTEAKDKRAMQVILLHNEIMDSLKSSLDKGINIGRILKEIYPTIPHGQWLPWIKENLPFSDQTARNYMKLHDHREQFKIKNVLNLTLFTILEIIRCFTKYRVTIILIKR